MRRCVVCLSVLTWALAGCYRWVPLTTDTPIGSAVHLDVTDEGTVALVAVAGPRVQSIVGDLLDPRPDTLVIAVREVLTRDGNTYFLQGTRLSIATAHLQRIQVRQLDRRRTTLAVLGGVVAAVAMTEALQAAGFGRDGTEGGGGAVPAVRIP